MSQHTIPIMCPPTKYEAYEDSQYQFENFQKILGSRFVHFGNKMLDLVAKGKPRYSQIGQTLKYYLFMCLLEQQAKLVEMWVETSKESSDRQMNRDRLIGDVILDTHSLPLANCKK